MSILGGPPPPPPPMMGGLLGPNVVASPELPNFLKKKPNRTVDVPLRKIPWNTATVQYFVYFLTKKVHLQIKPMTLSEKSFWAHTDENAHHANDELFADLRSMFASGKRTDRPESSLSSDSVATDGDGGSLKRDTMKKKVRKPIVINDDKVLQALGSSYLMRNFK